MNAFFDELSQLLATGARRSAAPRLAPQVADELLELARVVAHTKERRFAPLSCYLAGLVASGLPDADAAALIKSVRLQLEREEDSGRGVG